MYKNDTSEFCPILQNHALVCIEILESNTKYKIEICDGAEGPTNNNILFIYIKVFLGVNDEQLHVHV